MAGAPARSGRSNQGGREMRRIAKANEQVKGYTWLKIPVPLIEQYVDRGDPATLKKIASQAQTGIFSGHSLTEALRPPRQWEEEDRRVVHVLLAAQWDDALWTWVDAQLAQEKPD